MVKKARVRVGGGYQELSEVHITAERKAVREGRVGRYPN
jgi:hypothetical protein